jgi:photosystem II stability/assembly factor-like uncharacterized protein
MKRFVAASLLCGFLWTVSVARTAVTPNATATEAKTSGQVLESVRIVSLNPGSQSPADILPSGGVIVLGPDPYAWRVWPGGKIEFSFDNSHTWEQQKSGVTIDLNAGSAPNSKVCWVVGKAGTVLLTTDRGKHWKKLSSPTTEDVQGVDAQDAKHASIWTVAHKHSFETNDGGTTWTANAAP